MALLNQAVRGRPKPQNAVQINKYCIHCMVSVSTVFDGLRFTLIDGHLDRHCMPDDLH